MVSREQSKRHRNRIHRSITVGELAALITAIAGLVGALSGFIR